MHDMYYNIYNKNEVVKRNK